jgi:hypothetical protein
MWLVSARIVNQERECVMFDDDFLNPATVASAATNSINTSEDWSVESVRDSMNHLMEEFAVLREAPSRLLMLRPLYEELKQYVKQMNVAAGDPKTSPDSLTSLYGIQIEVFDDNMEMMRRWLELSGRGVKVKVVRVDVEKTPNVGVYKFDHRG